MTFPLISVDNQVVSDLIAMGKLPYHNAHRFYHNMDHIQSMAVYAEKVLSEKKLSEGLFMAIVWHDHVILNRPDMPGTEEQMSRVLWCASANAFNVKPQEYLPVADMIVDTARHFSDDAEMRAMTPESKTLLSLDLIGLAAPADTFIKNTVNIYREYRPTLPYGTKESRVDKYLEARKGLFKTLQARPSIYYDEEIRAELETGARFNLSCFVDGLYDDLIMTEIDDAI